MQTILDSLPETPSPVIDGRVVDPETQYPVADARVRLVAECGKDDRVLAEGTTGAGGEFRLAQIAWEDRDREPLAVIADLPGLDSEAARSPVDLPVNERLTIHLSVHGGRVTRATWRTIGRTARDARIAHLDALADQLLAPAAASVFGELDLSTRHAAARALESAFLDPRHLLGDGLGFADLRSDDVLGRLEEQHSRATPTGRVGRALADLKAKVTTFDSILEARWVIDPDAIIQGDVGRAVDRFADIHRDGAARPGLDLDFDPDWIITPSPTVGYRDYLRTIFTELPSAQGYGTHLTALEGRFHQDFETKDDIDKPANEVVAAILGDILVAPTGAGHGFGIVPATIEARGERTHRQYVDYLIGLSGISSTALGHRFRLDLGRPDSVVSSPVRENIFTLRRFYADDFQLAAEANPIIPTHLQGLPPFFLQYEEWLEKQAPFWGENYYRPQDTFFIDMLPSMREATKAEAAKPNAKPNVRFLEAVLQVQEQLLQGNAKLDLLEYGLARVHYEEASRLASSALWGSFSTGYGSTPSATTVISTLAPRFAEQLALPMKGPKDLDAYVKFFRFTIHGLTGFYDIEQWINGSLDKVRHSLVHLLVQVLPTLLADVALATGDYAGAIFRQETTTGFIAGRAKASDSEGWIDTIFSTPIPTVHQATTNQDVYVDGGLPYTTPTKPRSWFPYWSPHGLSVPVLEITIAAELVKQKKIHPMERRFFALRYVNALLEWADSLYRGDDASGIQRARELYKAALWLMGETPAIGGAGGWWIPFFPIVENPALVSQRHRGEVGLSQIDAGLNWYGADDSVVPPLRYRPLKDAADRFAASAKSAQQDFILSISKVEDALREELITANMLKKADLQAKIAGEQAKIAEVGVQLAQQQVKAVQAQIEAKEKEIEDHNSLFSQFGEVFEGMAKVIGGMPGGMLGGLKEGAAVGTGLSSASQGSVWASGAAAGGAVLGAYALFLYAGITSMQAMTDAQTSREGQLRALQNEALPLAEAQVTARQREVGIAKLQQQIAEADAELAGALIRFQRNRFLNVTFWAELGTVMKRVMRRYLALGGRYGWLAERALAYEQDRPLDIIRFDYFPERLQGITGADLLWADLTELDAARLEGMRRTVPIQQTYSLAFDFPLQFGQLKRTGSCSFMTDEASLTAAYPGTYAYRIRAVTVAVQSYAGAEPPRGLLTNLGASFLTREDGSRHISLRTVDALPLSEFRLAKDLAVYGLPDETLMPFEGSGVETAWSLEFPPGSNTALAGVADVQLTVDMQALYPPTLRETHLAAAPTDVRRFVFLSAAYHDPKALEDLHGAAPSVTFDFPLTAQTLPANEKNRRIANVVVLAGATAIDDIVASLVVGGTTLGVTLEDGIAFSNAPPLTDALSTVPASPLNVLAGKQVPGVVRLTIKRNANPGVKFANITDVVFGLEYTAELIT